MKVTYTGKTVRNNKERTVTYTGGVGTPSVKNGVTATYIGGKQSKAVYDAEAKTREARRNAAETQQSTGREVGDISALGAGNYGADKRIFGEGYNVGQGLAKAGQIGLTQIAKVGSIAGAWLENQLGNFAREGTNGYWDPDTSKWLFNRWNQAIDADAQGVQQRYAENTQRGGRAAEVFEDMAAATVAAIPQAGAAFLTGGASAAAQAGALAERAAATPGLVGTISRGMRAMAKDPNFQLSFVQVFGPGYEQAKADGADDLRASLYAVGNGLMNAAVEVGGGIQTLPKELQTGGNAWKSWVDSMLDEGKEEVVQGVIERAMQNTVYGRDNPYIGVGNGAIFDPAAAAEEFAGGAVVGGLLGGGQIGLNTLANRAAYNAAKAQYNRDVRQNTAPEMDSKAAQAVDAITRGESITGNQAAAIAKNPVAVETLEANTGVKLNTQQPISQLKRDIAALASRDTTHKQPQGTTATPVTQRRAQKPTGGFLEAGQKVYQEMSRTAEDVPTLYAGFSSVYNAGLNGIEASKAKGAYASILTPEQRYAAYNAGLEDAAAQVARENAEVKSVTTTAGAGLADNVYSRAVIDKSKRTAATLNAMGKKLGVRIEFVDSVMGGQANGQYIRDKNLIQIAVDSNKPYLNVAAHEVTHRMQDLSPAEYRKFRQAAMEHRMREKGIDEMAEVVEWYREKAESSGVTLTQDEVMDEIAADFAGNMMENPDLFREFSQSNRTAAQKLLDSLKEFIAKVKSIFTGKARDAAAQEAYGKDFAELEAVAHKWQEAFDAAEQQAERAKTAAGEGERKYVDTNAARSVGVSVDANTESASPAQYSLKTWSESDYVTQREKAAEELSVALNVSIRTATKYIDNINSVAKMIADDRVRLDYEASPGRSSFVSNSEYGGSLDFSTICKKRRLLTGTLEAIQRALPNTALTADEILSIRRMMADKGYEVSCGLCYVEGSRAKMGVYTKEFLEEYAKSGAEYVPNMAEMNTATGQERIRSEHPEVYEAYEKYMNKLAQRKPKLYQLATEYQGEIRKKFKGKGSVEEKNKNGGMRLQSFSDFEIIHLIDCMQAIMDMSEVGLAGQAYTKVPDFAWALGDTGLKINLSLIAKGVDANGNIILDETEGMTRSDAEALRKRYPKNVGTILVVFNDAQLRAAMKNDFIDFIIPFHRSQWNSAQYEALGLPQGAKDYTPWQNESYIDPVYNKTGKKQRPENYMPNEYWDYGRSGKENAEKYLRMCAENNRKPKFSFLLDKGADGAYHLKADGSTDGYWKLLIDFKMYDNVGNGSPQMPVSPKFNMEECERMLRDYTGGHAAFPVANDVVDQFVEAYKESNPGVRFSLKKPVEETKNLLALHNLTEKNLLDAAKLGGLPMPSIAIVKADEGHGEYGDISFLFSKDTIDPQLFRSNKVYGYDAWTPTAPRIEYEVNEKSAKKIHDLFYRMERSKGRSFADPLYSAANTLEDELNRKGGVDKVVGAMRDDPRMMNIYLEDTGRGAVENVMKREVTRMDDNQQEMASFLIRELGESTVNDFRAKGGESPIAARKLWYKEHGEALNAALQKYYEKLGLPAKDAADVVNAETVAAKTRYMLDTRKYLAGNTETVTEEVDRDATNKAIRDKVNQKEYEQWLDDLFDGVVKNEGIYNGKDYYTSSGNRRSFSATHYEITLENIVKAMKQGDQKGANTFFGGQAIWGVASKDYGSIDEIKADSGRLQKLTEEEYSAIRQKYSERLAELTNEIKDPAARNEFIASDDAASAIVETLRTKRTVAAIDKELRTYPTLQIKPDTAEKVLQLYKDISNMPTGYFEAKPQRAVGFDEVLAAVIPNDASAEVKAALENAGVRMIEYASGDEKSRLDAVNSVEGARFQLRSTADIEQEMRDLKRERTALASRNRALEQRVQDLKGEMRISKEPSVVLRDVKRLGLDTIRRYDSDVKYADIQTDMEALGNAVMKKDVSMSDMMPYAKRVAEKIVDNTAELTENGAELLEIRDYLKRQKILFNGEMDHYNEFRKQHIGTMKLNKTEGTPVDTIYAEMTEMFGEGYFPSDVYTEADKLYRIADVLDGMDAIYQNPFAGYRDAAVQEIANDIIDGMISDQVRQKKTYADRVALEKQEAVGRVREMLYKEREKRKGQIKQLRKEYNEKTQKGREKRYATEMRARIARHTGSISEKLLRPTDKKHIPEELRVVVADLLRNINLESAYSYDENGRLRKNAGGDQTRRTQEAVKLKKAYEDIIAREGNMVVDPDLLDSGGLLDSLAALGGKRIADMNVAELETVWNAVRSIEATLTSYDRTLANQKYARTSEWADSLMMGSMSRKRRNRKISLDMADPYTFFSAYGDGGMQIYRTLRNAQDREHVMLTELREAAKKFLDADVYKNRFERHTFTTSRGVELTLTNEQIMNLYNLAKRGEQSMNHLMVGGIVQPEIKRDGKLKAIPRGTENILLTLEDVKAITSVLTPEQIKVADGLQKLASTKLAEWGNEASMAVYGYRKFMEAHYWPIKTAKEATASSVEKGPDIAREIKNMGSAKALTPNASNALDIGGVYDVFAQNASDMIKYATLLAPMEDINRLYNYRYRDSMGNLTGKNVRHVLSGVYGDAAQSYWRNLMRDVQNGMVKNASATTRAVERIVGNTKGAAVGANLRVVIQQPTAYFRAAVVLDPENMAKGLGNGVTKGNGWDKARKWAPIAGIKDTSGFDQGSRYTIAREVYGTDGGVLEWLNDKSMALAGKADAVTWGKIWNACEWQVASETNLEVGSDAYYRQVAAVFTDVIDQTQVVDGIMQRTQIMRDSDALTRQATSFMGEPLKSLNILMRAYDAWAYENNPQKRSSALKKLKRSVAALVVTDAVNALAQSIVDGLRDDDKDKNWAERILEAFTGYSGDEENAGEAVKNVVLGGNLISNMNPAGRIPYVKDILSILQGYTVDRMDAAAADDIIRTSKTFIKGLNGDAKTTTAYNLKQVMLMCSKVFGISIGNMGRDMWSIARSIASDTGNVRLMFEMEKAIYRMDKSAGNRKRWCELLYRAQKDNDTETARLIYKEMLEHGYEETDVRQGVEAIMKAEQKVKSVDDLKNRWRAP